MVMFGLFTLSIVCTAQSIQGIPSLSQKDSTTFELTFNTDSSAVITVHAAIDSTYRSAFVFLGRTVGDDNKASITLAGLANNTDYIYRIFIGTELSLVSGSFTTGNSSKK